MIEILESPALDVPLFNIAAKYDRQNLHDSTYFRVLQQV